MWSNSCFSHPRVGEKTDVAARRRVTEELGLETEVTFLFKFEYRASYAELGTEHELCSVYAGQADSEPIVNTTEIQSWEWIPSSELNRALKRRQTISHLGFESNGRGLTRSFPKNCARVFDKPLIHNTISFRVYVTARVVIELSWSLASHGQTNRLTLVVVCA
ncbi:MAG: hypothetical protein Ct9H300mP8_03930 [Gammaproteobacteria bacterium]|nr:MAG: hypothetical protein Ct9H300mP8_03930 [Gammaproteobacteria bacterium]